MVKHKMSVVVAVQVFLNCASLAESSSWKLTVYNSQHDLYKVSTMQCVHEYKVVSIKMSTCSAVLDAIPVGLEGSSIFRSRLYAWGVRKY